MPATTSTPTERPSLTTDLESRYGTQHAGGAFDVKETLGGPGNTPVAGTIIDALSAQATTFQSPAGFLVKEALCVTQFLDAQGSTSKQLSRYVKGLDTRKYKP